ncbi:cytochrome B6 [Candidatus Methylospira mobilis]|uniref:Cytochrome B6 n=1 Tax=Candidatus Methylospira mobilis TaxID=1808979 RepID=A0A5Q0BI06_9GAMM|nr:cytochrome B6 [Candidatus Methylospira mobilis]QFY42752.1 cytochrome B6 [Candidatus Methylospira mobilis]WNV04123.1 cytochrome B6 [Candidatus Methylospira mobilis]
MSVWSRIHWFPVALSAMAVVGFSLTAMAADESLPALIKRLQDEKPKFAQRQQALLAERYDLADRPAKGTFMSRGKPVQDGVRVKLPEGVTWEKLAALTPDEIKEKRLWPAGFLPLPHPHHEAGGMVFPKFLIEETRKQTERDLTRFDLDFDLPDHFLPEFPAPIYLTTRPDLGDVSQGKLVTLGNFNELFKDILNPKQLEGLRLLVTPFPQQQFNATEDRRSLKPHLGAACFDCHANGHTNASTHTVGDIRPNEHRHRIDTPSLRGVNIQRLFGSQRALKTVEDFTEFEQRAAYFDGIPADAARKGTNILERGSQVHFMAEFQALLDFPPAPKLNVFGKLNLAQAGESEIRGQEIFFGKGQCAACHTPPYYTDNLMHNLKTERFFKEVMINGRKASADGPIKTFPLRGIKDSPPYLHDDRLLTLEDTVEFFNLVLELKLNTQEKKDLVAFLLVL